MKIKRFIFIAAAAVFLLAFYLIFEHSRASTATHTVTNATETAAEQTAADNKINHQQIPTVFIHGWKGSKRSYRTMLERLHANYDGPERAMIVTVRPNGVINVSGRITNQKIPIIQIIFSRNHEPMEQQAAWLNNIFRILKKNYTIDQVNVVSHSMGGKAFTCYLEKIKTPVDYPKIRKYVAIAAPFDWISGPLNDTHLSIKFLKQQSYLYHHRDRLPNNLDVLAIAGIMSNAQEGDGVVTLKSAFFGKYFFNPKHYSEKIVYGPNAQHSMLHENPEVDKIVADYLWGLRPKN
ncbi:alpha/beta hydrolase [Sporolactobacillus terrae]|uniref:alpha/beta hydrolase n=1 Tax=Sporolactobacillus terrae TaxID=269673 RepID=UPI0006859BDF|nr:alpha/beta hydrolase [Sporolactobacillus terrae]UAK17384.1 alpha/beta hydrolase [Sporolactobacillus terrae]